MGDDGPETNMALKKTMGILNLKTLTLSTGIYTLLLATMIACGSGDGANSGGNSSSKIAGRCHVEIQTEGATAALCYYYPDISKKMRRGLSKTCAESLSGEWTDARKCSKKDAVGTCKISKEVGGTATHITYYPKMEEAKTKEICIEVQEGKWISGQR